MNEGMEAWEDYAGYREGQLEQHVVRELDLVKKTTFLFIPQGSLRLDEPPYLQIPEDMVGQLNKFLFLNASLGN